jgi:AraC-like DNA-binding protein
MGAWNKVEFSREDYIKVRRMYFNKISYAEILEETGFTKRVVSRIAKEKNWSKHRDRYYEYLCRWSYRNGVSIFEVCNRLGISYESVKRIKRDRCIKTKRFVHNKRIKQSDKNKFIELYRSGSTAQDIASVFGFATPKTVLDVLQSKNIPRRPARKRTFFNKDYFVSIDTCDKAYILGLLLTQICF